jgi:hypothetical protein
MPLQTMEEIAEVLKKGFIKVLDCRVRVCMICDNPPVNWLPELQDLLEEHDKLEEFVHQSNFFIIRNGRLRLLDRHRCITGEQIFEILQRVR